MSNKRKEGITPIEVLTIAGLIALFFFLGAAWIQSAREVARRDTCSVNLSRIYEALTEYEKAHGFLPAGTQNPSGPIQNHEEGIHFSWIGELYPYLVDSPAGKLHPETGAYSEENKTIRATPLPRLRCPSFSFDPANVVYPFTNYAGCHHDREAPIDSTNNGVFFLNSKIVSANIVDGKSHTLYLGEKGVDKDDLGWLSGTRSTLRNTGTAPNQRSTLDAALPQLAQDERDRYVGGFASSHPRGAQFLVGSGSVYFWEENIDPVVFRQWANRSDGVLEKAMEND